MSDRDLFVNLAGELRDDSDLNAIIRIDGLVERRIPTKENPEKGYFKPTSKRSSGLTARNNEPGHGSSAASSSWIRIWSWIREKIFFQNSTDDLSN